MTRDDATRPDASVTQEVTVSQYAAPTQEVSVQRPLLYLDAIGGVSGDMLCAALLDLGVPLRVMEQALSALHIDDLQIGAEPVERHAIAATRFVVRHGEQHHHRTYQEIDRMLDALGGETQRIARAAFLALAKAEAKVHNVAVEDVHFHEVGALDSIADIVCAAAALAELDCEVRVSPIPLGRGFVRAAHGALPLPAPATLECLRGFETYDSNLQKECVTPTGAALLAAVAKPSTWPAMRPLHIGWGAGTRDDQERPNVLRAVMGERAVAVPKEASAQHRQLVLLEANVDDASPEIVASCIDELLEAGARDAWQTPIVMKKGRAAVLVSALVDPALEPALMMRMMTSTGTLGVRKSRVDRFERTRESVVVETRFGEVRVKVATDDGLPVSIKAEFDDCWRLAQTYATSVRQVQHEAEQAYRASVHSKD